VFHQSDVENVLCKVGYNAVLSADASSIDLTGYYTISNNCGRDIALDKVRGYQTETRIDTVEIDFSDG
jgi:hypothetical protein